MDGEFSLGVAAREELAEGGEGEGGAVATLHTPPPVRDQQVKCCVEPWETKKYTMGGFQIEAAYR